VGARAQAMRAIIDGAHGLSTLACASCISSLLNDWIHVQPIHNRCSRREPLPAVVRVCL
jgi:hypothetical protein